ncbi:4'-phosphopantetheinyl transferase superfamily protein [Pseudomonas sp. CDFA 602]|uniref:4'-phosphopantetheinyl transferase family protein n=1 Tax=Pseudomonas californiensis TaxID=2829823 RepID=UPI001E2C5545|nr:4'-phosphopantetheinyl transferase superfamily protein [Pseudomonas californiensis]MCD5995789.1 4'-phosphopantetheinyl transferase superfamily protein [Pseudomonas californiensis]MCD6001358.1 4'-phosphopantetheinyl transferase superfamily protein [Pseudomonas californiensis]
MSVPQSVEQVWSASSGLQPKLPDGVLLVSAVTGHNTSRIDARALIRARLCAALACALQVPPVHVTFISTAGCRPRVLIEGWPEPGLSISHDAGLSLAAVNLHGTVGVDLMRVQCVPDWQQVARDYLGDEVAGRLLETCDALRPQAFSSAWCQREAVLKLSGQPLAEWTHAAAPACSVFQIALPNPFVGALALM